MNTKTNFYKKSSIEEKTLKNLTMEKMNILVIKVEE